MHWLIHLLHPPHTPPPQDTRPQQVIVAPPPPVKGPSAIDIAAVLIERFEGFRSTPYRDMDGTWTIGYGSIRLDGHPVTPHTRPISKDRAYRLMMEELDQTATDVDGDLLVILTDSERAALYSFAYDVGTHAFERSDLLRLLNAGEKAAAAAHFSNWVYAKGHKLRGLVSRRAFERAVFLGLLNPSLQPAIPPS